MNEYRFEANGKEYEVKFTILSLSLLEEWTGKGVAYLADENNFGVNTVIHLLRAGLVQKNKGLTHQAAMKIWEQYAEEGGDRKELFDALINSYQKSVKAYLPFNEEEDDDEGNN